MSKYQKLAASFCFLSAVSIMLGQLTRTSFTYAPLVGFFSGFAFSILATFTAFKAYAVWKNQQS